MNDVVITSAMGDADAHPSKHTARVRDLNTSGGHGSAVADSQLPNHGNDDTVGPAAALSSAPCKMSTVGAPDVSGCPTISQTVASRVNDLETMCHGGSPQEQGVQLLPKCGVQA